jgi:hypothetical protein
VVDQDAAHEPRGHREEVRPTLPPDPPQADQLHVGLVHEGGGLEGVTRALTGGTGKFEGATGQIDNIGEVDMNRGVTVFRYTGKLCR